MDKAPSTLSAAVPAAAAATMKPTPSVAVNTQMEKASAKTPVSSDPLIDYDKMALAHKNAFKDGLLINVIQPTPTKMQSLPVDDTDSKRLKG
jgi:hypothetical protein